MLQSSRLGHDGPPDDVRPFGVHAIRLPHSSRYSRMGRAPVARASGHGPMTLKGPHLVPLVPFVRFICVRVSGRFSCGFANGFPRPATGGTVAEDAGTSTRGLGARRSTA